MGTSAFQSEVLALIDRAVKRCQGLGCSPVVAERADRESDLITKVVVCRQPGLKANSENIVEIDVYADRVQILLVQGGSSSLISSLSLKGDIEERLTEILAEHFGG